MYFSLDLQFTCNNHIYELECTCVPNEFKCPSRSNLVTIEAIGIRAFVLSQLINKQQQKRIKQNRKQTREELVARLFIFKYLLLLC